MKRKLAWVIGLAWLLLMVPPMILGFLWSGNAPFWPPVTGGSKTDFIVWVSSFLAAYALPIVAVALLLVSEKRTKT